MGIEWRMAARTGTSIAMSAAGVPHCINMNFHYAFQQRKCAFQPLPPSPRGLPTSPTTGVLSCSIEQCLCLQPGWPHFIPELERSASGRRVASSPRCSTTGTFPIRLARFSALWPRFPPNLPFRCCSLPLGGDVGNDTARSDVKHRRQNNRRNYRLDHTAHGANF
jgi:hypothetical protein